LKSRENGMSRRWDVAQLKSRANGMSRNWEVAQMGYRAIEMSRKWDVAQLICRASEESRKWDVAQLKCRADGISRKKCRANDVNPNGTIAMPVLLSLAKVLLPLICFTPLLLENEIIYAKKGFCQIDI